MKTIPYELNGHTFYLCLNGQALFDAYDKFGYEAFITKSIEGTSKASFENACWLLSKLAEQGELVRRWQGLDRGPIAPPEYFKAHLKPLDVAGAKDAIREAISLGFSREEEHERRVRDLGLEELQKKNGKSGITRSWWLDLLTQFLRLSVREGLLLTPGQVLDLQELEIQRRGLRREEDNC